jgi:ABC-type transport system involved in multi-copper enzyme maturation permease subunit
MYCSTCGTLINTELNYCNRCGARVDKLAVVEKPSKALGLLSAATGFVGIGGLALTVGLIAILLSFAVKSEVVVMLTLAFLVTVFGISFLMLRQISQMSNISSPKKEKVFEIPQLNKPSTAQLEEPRQPARSVTENTTRTLEKELVK